MVIGKLEVIWIGWRDAGASFRRPHYTSSVHWTMVAGPLFVRRYK